jgi:hypothetical protein
MKHDKLSSMSFKKKESKRCKDCERQASKNSNYCWDHDPKRGA